MSIILSIFFRLLYHELAWAYDLIASLVSGGRWRAWVNAVIPFVTGPNVLELGIGPGHLLLSLSNRGLNLVGLESSYQMLRQARRTLAQIEKGPFLVRGLGQSLPFYSQTFHTVVATFPTSFVFQPAALQGIRRVLLPGGSLVVLLSAWITDRSLLGRFLTWLFRITGHSLSFQVNEEELLRPFLQAGLDASLHWVDSPGSRLLFVIATRK
jgi:ubiquinone/menaquinone biosynthesis C-methylase UbiE